MADIATLRTETFPASAFRVRSLRGSEGLSTPFHFELLCEASGAAAAELRAPGTRCQLRLFEGSTVSRELNGVVQSVRTEGRAGDASILALELVPLFWTSGLRRTRRIFQQVRAPEVVRAVLEEHGVDVELRLHRDPSTYDKREYCVQYDETDVRFVERLLAEEQIFYFFDTAGDKTVLVLADEAEAYTTLAPSVLTYTDNANEVGLDTVRRFSVTAAIAPRAAALRDYDAGHPQLNQHVESQVPASAGAPPRYEVFDYPGGYRGPSEGKHRVALKLRALRCDAIQGRGISLSRRIAPGRKFTLEDHPFDDHNRAWAVTALVHEAHLAGDGVSKPTYECHFECVPSDVAFLPQPIAKPSVSGIESAVITGAAGEEITVDGAGRVHAEFHWDRADFGDDRSSCWIRVAQTWSGTGFGFVFIPRVGMEVIVSFLGGDPDRPIITGCVYNADHPHPYALPQHKTRSTIRTRSSPGGEGFNVTDRRHRDASRARACLSRRCADHANVFLKAAGVMSSSLRPKRSRWVPSLSKAHARYACAGTPMVRHVAMIPSRTHAR